MAMRIYFVRHASCITAEANPAAHPPPDDPLSSLGQQQAQALAGRFEKARPHFIATSTDRRAEQTCAILASQLRLPYCSSALFAEWLMPSSMFGKDPTDYSPAYHAYRVMRDIDPDVKYEDGESVGEVIARVAESRKRLLTYPSDSTVLVVSHYNFIRLFAAAELIGAPDASPAAVLKTSQGMELGHTGVSRFDYSQSSGRFRLFCWNDQSHLIYAF
jgi:broad specificity phosphatase PhoE